MFFKKELKYCRCKEEVIIYNYIRKIEIGNNKDDININRFFKELDIKIVF